MSRLSIFVCLVVLISCPACGDDDTNSECAVGDYQECVCTGLPEGLQVCRAPDGDVWRDCDCPPADVNSAPVTVGNLMWQTTLGPKVNPTAADTYCTDSTDSSHTDWRLPTRAEFETLFSGCAEVSGGFIQCSGQCNDASFCNTAAETWYRTATTAGSGQHYIIHTGRASIIPVADTVGVHTICVRDAP